MRMCRAGAVRGVVVVFLGALFLLQNATAAPAARQADLLKSRADQLERISTIMRQRVSLCPGAENRYVTGSDGFQISSAFLDCDWAKQLSARLDRFRAQFPRLSEIRAADPAARFLFDFGIYGNNNYFAHQVMVQAADERVPISKPGCVFKLRVTYLSETSGGILSLQEWDQELRCLPYGVPFDPSRRFPYSALREQTEALMASFVFETAPDAGLRLRNLQTPRTFPEGISVKISDRSGGLSFPWSGNTEVLRKWRTSYARLTDEVSRYFASTDWQLPAQVRRLEIRIRPNCIRSLKEFGRHGPSSTGLFQDGGGQQPVAEVNVRAVDRDGRSLLFHALPNTTVPYRDTILLPFHPGAFVAQMMRIRAELSMMLRPNAEDEPVAWMPRAGGRR
ncbi:MAG: hypothetical protein V1798_07400 [Pseudomonadota bacterium]